MENRHTKKIDKKKDFLCYQVEHHDNVKKAFDQLDSSLAKVIENLLLLGEELQYLAVDIENEKIDLFKYADNAWPSLGFNSLCDAQSFLEEALDDSSLLPLWIEIKIDVRRAPGDCRTTFARFSRFIHILPGLYPQISIKDLDGVWCDLARPKFRSID